MQNQKPKLYIVTNEQYTSEKIKKLNELGSNLVDLSLMIYYSNRLDSKNSGFDIKEATDLLKVEFNFKFNDFLKLKKEYSNVKLDYFNNNWEFYPDLPIEELPTEDFKEEL